MRQHEAIQEIVERQWKALQRIIDQQQNEIQKHLHQIVELKGELQNTQQYLNLFLNHPAYKAYKFLKKGRMSKATTETKQEKTENEFDVEIGLKEGDRFLFEGHLQSAEQMYRSAVLVSNFSINAVARIIRLLHACGEFAKGQQIARDALDRNAKSLVLLQQLGDSYLATGIFHEAKKIYNQILETWPEIVDAWLGLADLAMGNANYIEAASCYERVLKLDSSNLSALSGYAECGLHISSIAPQTEQLRKLHKQNPLILSILSPEKPKSYLEQSSFIQNQNAKILFIDEYLPLFDRNSGNHRTYQLTRLIRKAGYNVTFLAQNSEHQKRYSKELEDLGIRILATDPQEFQTSEYSSPSFLEWWNKSIKPNEYQLAILSRFQTARIFLPLLRAFSPETTIMVDTVDVHFLREQRRANLYGSQQMHKHASETKEMELETCRKADALITVSADDAEVLKKELGVEKPIKVIPTIHQIEKSNAPFSERRDLVFVGNFAHPPNSDAMYYFYSQIYPLIQKEISDLYLYVVGGNSRLPLQSIVTDKIILTGYIPSIKPFLQNCRLSINPIRYGAGMKGKIGEAMAHGLPVVTTSIAAEGFSLQPKTHALVADSPEDFASAVVQTYRDETLWHRLRENALKLVEERYSPDAVFPSVRSLLEWALSLQR